MADVLPQEEIDELLDVCECFEDDDYTVLEKLQRIRTNIQQSPVFGTIHQQHIEISRSSAKQMIKDLTTGIILLESLIENNEEEVNE